MFKIIRQLRKISISKYIYYNYFCRNIKREKGIHLVPYKGACIEFGKGSVLRLKGKNLEVGSNKINGSKAETYIRLKKNSIWKCNNGGMLVYGSDVEVHESALLESGFFYANTSTSIVCTKHITIGEDVWMGRNIIIYDSDYHQMQDMTGKMINASAPVNIGNHVWLTNQIMVLKGVNIGDGAVVAPYTVIRNDVERETLTVNGVRNQTVRQNVRWSSKRVTDWGYEGIHEAVK